MILHLIFNSNILKFHFQLIVLSDLVLVAWQLGICDTDRGLPGGGRLDEKYCSASCLLDKNKYLLTIFTNIFFFFSSDLFCVVYVIGHFF